MLPHDDNKNVSRETESHVTQISKSLGRGLDSLLGPSAQSSSNQRKEGLSMLPLTVLNPSRYQPRTFFDEAEMQDLAASIQENGVLQPILVRPIDERDLMGTQKYEIIAGERRWRASKLAGRKVIPVVIRHLSDKQALESGLIENIQRDDLDAIEEANGYQRLINEFEYTQEAVSKIIGKSRSHIANTLRLLSLPKDIQGYITSGNLSAGHGKILIGHERALDFANLFIREALSVRNAESLVARYNKSPFDLSTYGQILDETRVEKKLQKGQAARSTSAKNISAKSDDVIALENELQSALGLPSKIIMKDDQSGHVQISFKSPNELDKLMNLIFGSL